MVLKVTGKGGNGELWGGGGRLKRGEEGGKWGSGREDGEAWGEDGEVGGVVVDFEGEVVVTLEVVEDVEDQC